MAIVAKRTDDKKYAHLKKVYAGESENNIEIKKIDSNNQAKLPEKKLIITRKQILIDLAYAVGLVLVSLSGYIIAKLIAF